MDKETKQKVFDELQMAQEYIESGIACLNVARRELGENTDVPGLDPLIKGVAIEVDKLVGDPLDSKGLTIHSLINQFEDTHQPLIWRNC